MQAMSFSPVTAGKSCIIADQSGSGKTLAYLVPVIQRLRQEELEGRHKSSSQAPTVIILAPTAELASQVFSQCHSISFYSEKVLKTPTSLQNYGFNITESDVNHLLGLLRALIIN